MIIDVVDDRQVQVIFLIIRPRLARHHELNPVRPKSVIGNIFLPHLLPGRPEKQTHIEGLPDEQYAAEFLATTRSLADPVKEKMQNKG